MSIKDLLHWHRLQDKGDPSVTEESNSEDKQHHDHHVHSLEDGFSRRRFMRTAATAAGATGLVLGSGLSTHVLADHDDHDDPFWKPIQNIHDMADVQAPVSMVGGWSDLFIPLKYVRRKPPSFFGTSKVSSWSLG